MAIVLVYALGVVVFGALFAVHLASDGGQMDAADFLVSTMAGLLWPALLPLGAVAGMVYGLFCLIQRATS